MLPAFVDKPRGGFRSNGIQTWFCQWRERPLSSRKLDEDHHRQMRQHAVAVFHTASFSCVQDPVLKIADLSSEELLLWIPVEVVCERVWCACDEGQHAIEVTAFSIVPLQPFNFVVGGAWPLLQRLRGRRVACLCISDDLPMLCHEFFRAKLVDVVLRVVVREDCCGSGEAIDRPARVVRPGRDKSFRCSFLFAYHALFQVDGIALQCGTSVLSCGEAWALA